MTCRVIVIGKQRRPKSDTMLARLMLSWNIESVVKITNITYTALGLSLVLGGKLDCYAHEGYALGKYKN